VLAVQDSYKLLPDADVLYGCNDTWWKYHKGVPQFKGERWSTHDEGDNNKLKLAEEYGLHLVSGDARIGFSTNPSLIHYGDNSGFQAVNMAILLGCTQIILVGFDMQPVGGKVHFFGDHPAPLENRSNYEAFLKHFNRAAQLLSPHIQIINATPGSLLTCWPVMTFEEALEHHRLHSDRALALTGTDPVS